MRLCIVGAGPAGLYLARRVLKRHPSAVINIVDARSTPFGLVKYGIAPDHPEVKNCIASFEEVLRSPRVTVYGNIRVGDYVSVDELQKMHDAVVLCTGMPKSRALGIPGESLVNSVSSAQFVGWYNGAPEYQNFQLCLRDLHRVAVIGHGNVALDVSRILLKPWKLLQSTEISKIALQELSQSNIKSVDIIGRRGPLQTSFTIAEIREMFDIPGVGYSTEYEVFLSQLKKHEQVWKEHRPTNRLLSLMRTKFSDSSAAKGEKSWNLSFFSTPKALIGEEKVEFADLERTIPGISENRTLEELKRTPVKGSGEITRLPYDLVVSCIGFQALQTFGLPADRNGVIGNQDGRVLGHPGTYVSGWAATGPEGELSSTMKRACMTADTITADFSERSPTSNVDLAELFEKKRVSYIKITIDTQQKNSSD